MTTELSHPRDRILDAAYRVFERCGVTDGTMSDVAEEAAVGRATLYRYFPGKGALVEALVLREARELLAVLDAELGAEDDTPAFFERGLLAALHHLKSHTLLQRMLREEPEAILPFLTVQGQPLLEAAIDFASPYVERAVKAERIEPVEPRAAAEWAARILLSLLLTPSVAVDLDDPEQLKTFVGWLPQAISRRGGNP
jgi:AcrR family transcriptional regulator